MTSKPTIIETRKSRSGSQITDVQTCIEVGEWSATIEYQQGEPLPFKVYFDGCTEHLTERDMWDLIDLTSHISTRLR